MSDRTQTFILVAIVVIVVLLISRNFNSNMRRVEGFTTQQKMRVKYLDSVGGVDPADDDHEKIIHPRASLKDDESLIFDNTTGAIMTGSQFMENTGIVAPPWVAPAWDPDAYGPASKGEINVDDYENDPRMLYNKCSLSCCSPQYPTPFQGTVDPFVCDKNGKSKYLPSSYICENNTGGTGCLCMTKKQAKNSRHGFTDY
jgi:hypothetical protein